MNRVSGNTGCNELSGALYYPVKEGYDSRHWQTTRMACLGDYNESAFLSVLQKATEWRISDKDMFLYEGRMQLARFHAALPSNAAGPGKPECHQRFLGVDLYHGPAYKLRRTLPRTKAGTHH